MPQADFNLGQQPAGAIASSATLPGSPTTTTQAPLDNSTKVATTAYVDAAVTAAKAADGGWVTPSLGNSWTAMGGGQTPQYRVQGNVVRLRGQYTPGGASGSVPFTLPAGARPSSALVVPLSTSSVANNADMTVSTAGVVTITYVVTSTNISQDGVSFTID